VLVCIKFSVGRLLLRARLQLARRARVDGMPRGGAFC